MEYLQLDFETMFEGYIDDYDPNETDTELQGLIYEVVRRNYQRPR